MAISFNKKQAQGTVVLQIIGRVDGVGSKALDTELKALIDSAEEITLDFAEVKYVSYSKRMK